MCCGLCDCLHYPNTTALLLVLLLCIHTRPAHTRYGAKIQLLDSTLEQRLILLTDCEKGWSIVHIQFNGQMTATDERHGAPTAISLPPHLCRRVKHHIHHPAAGGVKDKRHFDFVGPSWMGKRDMLSSHEHTDKLLRG